MRISLPSPAPGVFCCADNDFAYIDRMQTLHLVDFARSATCCHWARCRMQAGHRAPPHRHDFHEVFWVEDGGGTHLLNGRPRPLSPGMLIFVHDRDYHTFDGTMTIINVAFARARWRDLVRRYAAPCHGDAALRREIILAPPDQRALEFTAADVAAGDRGPLATDRLLLNMLYLLQPQRPAQPAGLPAMPEWLARALGQVGLDRRHFQSTRAFAQLAGYSPEHVARALRRFTGRTPTEIINAARMRYATRRLIEGHDTIMAIALDCGFQGLGHFYRLFEQAHGLPPPRLPPTSARHRGKVRRRGREVAVSSTWQGHP